jgi:predicted amidohydrolase
MSIPIKIATAQCFVTGDVSANAANIVRQIETSAGAGARLISFPEGALSGYVKSEIASWDGVDWRGIEMGFDAICRCCASSHAFAVVGSAHKLGDPDRPHNSLYVISDQGELLTRYDKRLLSHSEITDWYTPGTEAITFEVDGYRFGCAICIEAAFPEVFAEYEALGVDAILYSSYGISSISEILLQAHAATNCIWLSASTPAQAASTASSGIAGPDGHWISRCVRSRQQGIALATIDCDDPAYEIPLRRARPWRAATRDGDIYRKAISSHPRSLDRRIK